VNDQVVHPLAVPLLLRGMIRQLYVPDTGVEATYEVPAWLLLTTVEAVPPASNWTSYPVAPLTADHERAVVVPLWHWLFTCAGEGPVAQEGTGTAIPQLM
jgi:hypothetical protein